MIKLISIEEVLENAIGLERHYGDSVVWSELVTAIQKQGFSSIDEKIDFPNFERATVNSVVENLCKKDGGNIILLTNSVYMEPPPICPSVVVLGYSDGRLYHKNLTDITPCDNDPYRGLVYLQRDEKMLVNL